MFSIGDDEDGLGGEEGDYAAAALSSQVEVEGALHSRGHSNTAGEGSSSSGAIVRNNSLRRGGSVGGGGKPLQLGAGSVSSPAVRGVAHPIQTSTSVRPAGTTAPHRANAAPPTPLHLPAQVEDGGVGGKPGSTTKTAAAAAQVEVGRASLSGSGAASASRARNSSAAPSASAQTVKSSLTGGASAALLHTSSTGPQLHSSNVRNYTGGLPASLFAAILASRRRAGLTSSLLSGAGRALTTSGTSAAASSALSLSPHKDHVLICGMNDKIGLLLRALHTQPPLPPVPAWSQGPAMALADAVSRCVVAYQ